VWCATGTPILNKPQDLYALLSLTDPTNFYNKNQFLRQYCVQNMYTGKWTFNSGGADYLFKHQLNGKYLARTMEEMGVELPDQFPVIHDIEFDKEMYAGQWDVIRQITESAQLTMGQGKTLPILAQIAIITRQRQANVWPGGISWTAKDENDVERLYKVAEDLTESIKIDKAIQIISEAVERGERVVLFSQFKTALAELQNRLDGFETDMGVQIRSVRFDGDTDDATSAAIKRNFDKKFGEAPKWDVVLANYKVGGTGLNYTAARRTVILDEEWNPGKRDQAYARTRRIGQDQTTFIDVLRVTRTVDTWLARLIEEKEQMIGGFNESANDMQSAWLAAFNEGEMNA
jgi:SNF2 family DNA or RNA helicase